ISAAVAEIKQAPPMAAAAESRGGRMASRKIGMYLFLVALVGVAALPASAQSFSVQCPENTITHPKALHDNNTKAPYTGPTVLSAPSATTYQAPQSNVNVNFKCQQIS